MNKILTINKINFFQIPYILLAILLIIQSCKDSGVDVTPVKDPRTYTWTIDTLEYPGSDQTLMYSIWGSSPKDVYVVGHNSRGFGKMWHFDGSKWDDVKLNYPLQGGNISGAIDLSDISGISGSNIWAVGNRNYTNPTPPPNFLDSSLILHYDGASWNEAIIEKSRFLSSIYVESSNNIWACGDITIYHYNGTKWTREYVPLVVPINNTMNISRIISDGTKVYATGTMHNNMTGNDIYYFFIRKSTGWSISDSSINYPHWGHAALWISPSGTLYSIGDDIFTWNGNIWIDIYFNSTNYTDIYGSSDSNIFAVGTEYPKGLVYHYNGTDWKLLDNLTTDNVLFTNVWTDGTEAFICGYTRGGFPQKTIILHGK